MRTARQRRTDAPRGADPALWATAAYAEELAARYDAIAEALHPDVMLEATYERGELELRADGAILINGIFLGEGEGPFIAAQRNARLDGFTPPSANRGRALVNKLRRLIVTENRALIDQVIQLWREASNQMTRIKAAETALNERLYVLYGVSESERRRIIENRL